MKKLKKLWPLFLSLAAVIAIIFLVLSQPKVVFFYGNTCPHCANVEEYLKNNPSKTKYRQLEVFGNKENAALMAKYAASCGQNTDSLGVPFLYDGKNCLTGDEDIINWFKKQ